MTITVASPSPSFVAPNPVEVRNGVVVGMDEAGEPALSINVEVVQGVTAPTLHRAARNAALLVLGARHHSLLLGSVSRAACSHPPYPVVVVPAPPQP